MDYREHYRIDAEEFDYFDRDFVTPDERRRREFMCAAVSVRPGQTLLDIGSGAGWFPIAMARAGARVTALDLSARNLDRIREIEPAVHTCTGDALEPPAELGTFDWITAFEVLEHLPDPEAAVAAWKALLNPGGRIVIAVPYKEKIAYTLCIHCNRKTPVHSHLHSFSGKSLARLLRSQGLRMAGSCRVVSPHLVQFRINSLLRWAPYPLWRLIDRCFVRWTGRARFLVITAAKGG
jgi:cyclopropane fatty-acyl-phospholipid synthase-like methyltransferase